MAMKISATKDESSISNKNTGGLFLGVVFVLLLAGILFLSLWVSELSRSLAGFNSETDSRLSILEEQLQLADSTSTEFLSDINTQLQFLDKEIRKLWDLSNKRNKVNIENMMIDLSKQSTSLKDIAMTQTNDQKNINAIESQLRNLQLLVNELSQSTQKNIVMQNKLDELNQSMLLLEETVQAVDTYRRQNNELLQELQLQVSGLSIGTP
jgi:hypothetical protein